MFEGLEFTRNQKLALIALAGIAAIGLSVSHGRKSAVAGKGDLVVREPGGRVVAGSSDAIYGQYASPRKVVCHVVGCVKVPGVYSLDAGKRVIDAVKVAGGAKPNADLNAINLAERVRDGAQILVPSVQQTKASAPTGAAGPMVVRFRSAGKQVSGGGTGSGTQKLKAPGEGVVHINSAGADELQRLPGVGPATAEKIIQYRKQIGKFTNPAQLNDVKGIGPKKLEKMLPFVAL